MTDYVKRKILELIQFQYNKEQGKQTITINSSIKFFNCRYLPVYLNFDKFIQNNFPLKEMKLIYLNFSNRFWPIMSDILWKTFKILFLIFQKLDYGISANG